MEAPDKPLEVHVRNHRQCAGDASDGAFRALMLAGILTVLVLIFVELRAMNSMYAQVHGEETRAAGQAVITEFWEIFEAE